MNCLANETTTDFGCIPNNPIGFASKFYGISLEIIGGLAVIFLIFAGYQILTSGGNQEKLQNGKHMLYITLGALGLIIGAGIILQVLLVNVLAVPGVGK